MVGDAANIVPQLCVLEHGLRGWDATIRGVHGIVVNQDASDVTRIVKRLRRINSAAPHAERVEASRLQYALTKVQG